MTTKTTGAEFKAFYNDPEFWPDGYWHDDTVITFDGLDVADFTADTSADATVVRIEAGTILDGQDNEVCSFETHFKRWRKKQTHACITVSVPKETLGEFWAMVEKIGVRKVK